RSCKTRDNVRTCGWGAEVTEKEQENPVLTIQCSKAGCESIWYHRECVEVEGGNRAWVCMPCGSGKRRR
ncbi:hypothetical protein B0H17DRAFT_909907, partial [Mycena rosella]